MRALAALVVIAACQREAEPPAVALDPVLAKRVTELAGPPYFGPTALLAEANAASQRNDLQAARDKLVAWARVHGGLGIDHAADPPAATLTAWTTAAQVLAHFNDDATLDAVVYFGTQLRATGTGLVAAMGAAQLETKLALSRPSGKLEWRYAHVLDEDFERLIASEWVYDVGHLAPHASYSNAFAAGIVAAHDAAIANGREVAPPAWYAIEIAVNVALRGHAVAELDDYIAKWVPAADAYNKWLDR
jgi:hypothetical protein